MDFIKASPYTKLFWIEHQLNPSRNDYNVVFDQTISGELDVKRLKNALKNLIQNHLLLNSHIIADQEGGLCWEQNQSIYELEIFLTNKEEQGFVEKPFQLETGPLYRFALFQLDEGCYDFIVVLHHVVCDGRYCNDFIRLVSSYYNNQHVTTKLLEQKTKLNRVFRNIEEKISYLSENNSHDFWRRHLGSSSAENELPYLHIASGNTVGQQVKEHRFNIDKQLLMSEGDKAREVSWFNRFIITWGILVAKYSNSQVARINYPFGIKEVKEFIYGANINTLILSINFEQNESFSELLARNKSFLKELKLDEEHKHSYLPTFQIIKCSPDKKLNVSFSQTNLKDTRFEFENCMAHINCRFNISIAGSELSLEYEEDKESKVYNFRLRYRADLFSVDIINRMQGHFVGLLNELWLNLNKPIVEIGLLTKREYRQIIHDWNQTDKDYPRNKTISHLFQEQVERTPSNIALVFENEKLTYSELNARANQLARVIRMRYKQETSQELKPDVLIALCLERSMEMIIVILAVLKTGGAYVPIDPNCPDERIKYILDDTQSPILLTQQSLEYRFAFCLNPQSFETENVEEHGTIRHQLQIIILDDNLCQNEQRTDLARHSQAKDLAYVIYTSGTTGKPKGIMIEHCSVVNYLEAQNIYLQYEAGLRCVYLNSYAFDTSVASIFGVLLKGAFLEILSKDASKTPSAIENKLSKGGCFAYIPPVLLMNIDVNNISCDFSKIVVSGELPPQALIERFSEKLTLINEYGPTECTVGSTKHIFSRSDDRRTIGKALSNIKTYVLDTFLNPVPIGVTGALYIAGAGLARGYLNRSELTAKQFIQNPFATEADIERGYTRLYKTGDLVRWSADSNLEYIGRNDLQVKVRGFRVEIGEIENALTSHPEIKQVAVLLRERMTSTGEKHKSLIAYYVSEENISEDALVDHLSQKVLDHMIPNNYIRINSLPLTLNGKLDRKALSDVELKRNEDDYLAPRNELEQQLCNVWQRIFGLDRVGIGDDFFRIGGDSIFAIQLANETANLTNKLNLTISNIFKYKTIKSMTKHCMADNPKVLEKGEI